MTTYTLPYFGDIRNDGSVEEYDTETEYHGRELQLDFTLYAVTEPAILDKIAHILSDMDSFDKHVQQFIEQDLNQHPDDSMTYDYLSFWLEEYSDYIEEVISVNLSSLENIKRLKDGLKISRIGFYPDEQDHFIVIDYSLNNDISDQLLAVILDNNCQLSHITWES